jgi:hypothetical protein
MLSPLAIAAVLWLQVPPPVEASSAADALLAERDAIRTREAEALEALAADLDANGRQSEAGEVRRRADPAPPKAGPARFVPIPEYEPAKGQGLAARPPAPAEAEVIADRAAAAFLELARKAADPKLGRYSLADACLREVLERRPDDPEARRLLGFVRHEGGWATPFAAEQLRRGMELHPTFGWVPADWVPHLNRGQLPGAVENGRPREWLPAEQADALRADFFRGKPWRITTEHFQIDSNAPLAEVIAFGRRLEDFHELFFSLMGDVIGREHLPLAHRFANPSLAPKAPGARERHEVWFFAEKSEYVEYLRPLLGGDVGEELGHYLQAGRYGSPARSVPARSYFYRDPGAQIAAGSTLFHEVSHQLLFESAGRSQFERNAGNFWLWEALGTYFETVEPQPDGSLEYGGLVGPRIAVTETLALDGKLYVPLETLTALGRDGFGDHTPVFTEPKAVLTRLDPRLAEGIGKVYVHYNQSMALAVFLMHFDGGRYRNEFLDYVRAAYDGRVNTTDRSLARFLGVPFATLDRQFLDYLAAGRAKPSE